MDSTPTRRSLSYPFMDTSLHKWIELPYAVAFAIHLWIVIASHFSKRQLRKRQPCRVDPEQEAEAEHEHCRNSNPKQAEKSENLRGSPLAPNFLDRLVNHAIDLDRIDHVDIALEQKQRGCA